MPLREHILAVDDEQTILRLMTLLLADAGYRCTTAESAQEARRLLAGAAFELALCDMTMPQESGLDLVRHLADEYPDTPVVMVTAIDDPELARAAVELGAYGYVVKPFTANVLLIAIANALNRRRVEIENRHHRERLAEIVLDRTAELRETVARLEESQQALRRSREEMIRRLALAVEFRDGETGAHVGRMSATCERIARRLGLPPERCELLRIASPLHDIGKIGIPDRILCTPDPLTPEDWEIVRQHPEIGHRMLAGSGQELLELAATIALTHHERVDGSGYPGGLRGDEIPIEGKIAAVADVFDALTIDRVYQPALPVDEAMEILEAGRGTHFAPDVLDALYASLDEDAALTDSRRDPGPVSEYGREGRMPHL
jgi:putative two-component system response regulator